MGDIMKSRRVIALILLLSLVSAVGLFSLSSVDAKISTNSPLPAPYRVKDINPHGSAHPIRLIAQDQGIYFAARAGGETALWRSDGTEQGTILVKSFGSNSIENPVGSSPWAMAGSNLYLTTDFPSAVWRSDGTEAGTVQLPGPPECDYPHMLTAVGNSIFFFADGAGDWLCVAGEPSRKVSYVGPDNPRDAVPGKSLLFFMTGGKIGVSDGTGVGTKIFDTPFVTTGGSSSMATIDDILFFEGCISSYYDCELWKLAEGGGAPQLVLDIEPGNGSSNPRGLFAMNDSVYFNATTEALGPRLWKSDGSAAGTEPIAAVQMCADTDFARITTAVLDNRLYFPGYVEESRCELWVTDGTTQGTQMVKDILAQQYGLNSSYPNHLTAGKSFVFFTAIDGTHGQELWATDGSESGTFLAGDIGTPQEGDWIYPCQYGSCPAELVYSEGKLFFSAEDTSHDRELWVLDASSYVPGAPEANCFLPTVMGR